MSVRVVMVMVMHGGGALRSVWSGFRCARGGLLSTFSEAISFSNSLYVSAYRELAVSLSSTLTILVNGPSHRNDISTKYRKSGQNISSLP